MLKKIIAATTLPVSVERARERLLVLHNEWDADIWRLIQAASNVFERETSTALQPSTWEATFDFWDWPLSLDMYPVRAISSVKYLDTNGAEQTVSTDDWYGDPTASGSSVYFVNSWSGPTSLYDRPGSVRVRFTAGYNDPETDTGSDSSLTLPAEVEMGVLFLVGSWLEFRESVMADQKFEAPQAFKYIASQLKVYR